MKEAPLSCIQQCFVVTHSPTFCGRLDEINLKSIMCALVIISLCLVSDVVTCCFEVLSFTSLFFKYNILLFFLSNQVTATVRSLCRAGSVTRVSLDITD